MSRHHKFPALATTALLLAPLLATAEPPAPASTPVAPASASAADTVRVFYFGNSLTGNTLPELHAALGASVGKTWKNDLMAIAGGQLWQYRDAFRKDGKIKPTPDNAGFTIDPSIAKSANYAAGKFLAGQWDAMVLQPFGARKLAREVVTEMWQEKFPAPIDLSDFASSRDLIRLFLHQNPQGTVYIYQDWIGMSLYKEVADVAVHGRDQELNHEQMTPLRISYDFSESWLTPYKPFPENVPAFKDQGFAAQDYEWQLFEKLKAEFPDLWAAGRLRMIPVGDTYLVLDRKARAGLVPGLHCAGEFFTDEVHHRAGMPAYIGAASFFTQLFRESPAKLDYTLYQDPKNLGTDRYNDKGVPLAMTPEVAKLVNDTIWEVARAHPYTRLSDQGSAQAYRALLESIPATRSVGVLQFGGRPLLGGMPAWQPAVHLSAGAHSRVHFSTFASLAHALSILNDESRYFPNRRFFSSPEYQVLVLQAPAESPEEVAAAAKLAEQFLAHRPQGRVLLWASDAFVADMRKQKPDLASRLVAVPVDAVLSQLGARDAGWFKPDGLPRTGLPRYAIAATLYAVTFGAPPDQLDAAFFNNSAAYYPDPGTHKPASKVEPMTPADYDNGPHLPFTSADKTRVDAAIWSIVSARP